MGSDEGPQLSPHSSQLSSGDSQLSSGDSQLSSGESDQRNTLKKDTKEKNTVEEKETTDLLAENPAIKFADSDPAAKELARLQAGSQRFASLGGKAADKDEATTLPTSGLIDLLFETCHASNLSPTHLKKMNQPMRVWSDVAKNYIDGKSPLELWETDEAYRLWLTNVIVPELKRATKSPSKAAFITTTINYARFSKFLLTEEGKAMVMGAKRAQITEPVAQERQSAELVEWSLKDAFK